jgi:hypothetical protein
MKIKLATLISCEEAGFGVRLGTAGKDKHWQ